MTKQLKRIEELLRSYRNDVISLSEFLKAVGDTVRIPALPPPSPCTKPVTIAAGI